MTPHTLAKLEAVERQVCAPTSIKNVATAAVLTKSRRTCARTAALTYCNRKAVSYLRNLVGFNFPVFNINFSIFKVRLHAVFARDLQLYRHRRSHFCSGILLSAPLMVRRNTAAGEQCCRWNSAASGCPLISAIVRHA